MIIRKTTKLIIILTTLTILTGCKVTSQASRIAEGKRAELRLEVFKECMNLAANVNKAVVQHYNDLDELVEVCTHHSYYMTTRMYFGGEGE